jgi:3-deoxy-D-manno-octulosonic-acid transferase
MYALYTALSLVAFVLASPWLAWQAFRHRKYVGTIGQRLGRIPVAVNLDGDESIWIHAVSVGEVLAARALVPGLRERYPGLKIFLSTTTRTGQHVARQNVGGLDAVFYFPLDLPAVVDRFLGRLRPRLFLMVETEIWPNLLRSCRQRGVTTLLVNGRISSRSFPRYRLVRPFMRRVLADVDRLCMQTDEGARRIVALGADPRRVVVTGSLKFDALDQPAGGPHALGRDRVLRFFRIREGRPVLMAASTLRGEEGPVLRAFREVRRHAADALLVVAPRHPERFDEVISLVRDEGFRVERRTELAIDAEPRADVVVLDTIGELARLFEIATVVFVGGSLVDAGGHNILEPAVYGKPVVFGPHMQNFAEIAEAFLANGAAVQVPSGRALAETLVALAGDPVRRASLGAAARALVDANRGARDRTLDAIGVVLPAATMRGAVVRPFRRVQ